MKITKTKTNIRERLASLLDFNQLMSGLKRAGINIGNNEHLLDVDGDVHADDYTLSNMDALLDVDAVEIYIYDTTRDTDAGAWRHRTSHTSWYNETLGTSTRGTRREFPVVAVIVAEANRLTIFDADGPSLDMWMRFELGATQTTYDSYALGDTRATLTSCCAKNATFVVGGNTGGYCNLWVMNLLTERVDRNYEPSNIYNIWGGNISERNQIMSWRNRTVDSTPDMKGWEIIDVDITVLPEAPIDSATGLQVPTIVSLDQTEQIQLITHDNKVVYITSDHLHGLPKQVEFQGDKLMIIAGNVYDRASIMARVIDIPPNDINLPAEINDHLLQGKRYVSGDFVEGDVARNTFQENMMLPIFSGTWLGTEPRIEWKMTSGLNRLFVGANQTDIQLASQYSMRDTRFYQLRYDTGLTDPGITNSRQSDYVDRRGVVMITTDGDESRWSDMHAHVSHNHNTGWCVGNNKLVTLCDTTPGTVGVDSSTELITDLFEAFPLALWNVNLNDGGNFDVNSFQKNADGQLVAVTLAAKANQSYFKSGFMNLKHLGVTPGHNHRMTVTARTTSVSDGYTAYVGLYQNHHGYYSDSGDPEGTAWDNLAASGDYQPLTDQSTTFTVDFRANDHEEDSLSVYFFMRNAAADQEIIIENISIKRMDDLILNGDMDSGAATGSWQWEIIDGTTTSITNNQIELHRTADNVDLVSQVIRVTPHKQHTISFEINKSTTSNAFLIISKVDPKSKDPVGALTESEIILQYPYLGVGKQSISFYPEQDVVYVMLKCNDVGTATFDNVSCKLSERDRSPYDLGLLTHGQIEKSPVAPGAELVCYHGFTPDNYFSQDFNHEMYFDNEDWCMSYWFYKPARTDRTYDAGVVLQGTNFETSPTGGVREHPYGGYISTYFNNSTQTISTLFRGLDDGHYTSTYMSHETDRWHHMMFMRRGDRLHVYIDGTLNADFDVRGSSGSPRTGFGEFPRKLYIGRGVLNHEPVGTNAKFALVKISATAPTDSQIKQIYQDESRLFQAGARCTLQHNSDNVQALCYDPDSQLLHVSTDDHTDSIYPATKGVTTFNNLIVHDAVAERASLIASKSNIYIQQ